MNIYKKLLEVKKQLPYFKKDKKGFNYTYVTPSQLFAAVNPILNEAGILLITNVISSNSYRIETPSKSDPNKKEWKYDLDFVFDWVDIDNGEKISIPWKASGVNGDDKGLGSALTYAERYFILKQFNIPTDDDDPDAFQTKHLSAEEKKAIEAEQKQKAEEEKKAAELKAREQARIEAEKKEKELNTFIEIIKGCKTVPALVVAKKTIPAWALSEPSFKKAANETFAKIEPVKEPVAA